MHDIQAYFKEDLVHWMFMNNCTDVLVYNAHHELSFFAWEQDPCYLFEQSLYEQGLMSWKQTRCIVKNPQRKIYHLPHMDSHPTDLAVCIKLPLSLP